MLLSFGGQVAWIQELIDGGLILAEAVGEHAAVVAVVVDTPLNIDSVAGLVGLDGFLAPVCAGLVVVDTDALVVSARSHTSNRCLVESGPSIYGLKDSALWASIGASLCLNG